MFFNNAFNMSKAKKMFLMTQSCIVGFWAVVAHLQKMISASFLSEHNEYNDYIWNRAIKKTCTRAIVDDRSN